MKTDTETSHMHDGPSQGPGSGGQLVGPDAYHDLNTAMEMKIRSLLVFCERCHDFIRARFEDDRADRIFDGDNREMDVRVWASKEKLAICWERVV